MYGAWLLFLFSRAALDFEAAQKRVTLHLERTLAANLLSAKKKTANSSSNSNSNSNNSSSVKLPPTADSGSSSSSTARATAAVSEVQPETLGIGDFICYPSQVRTCTYACKI